MKLLIKVIEHQFIDTIITQEIIDSEIVIEQDIRNFGIAKFTAPMIEIQEDNIVEIYEVQNTDKLIFRGYVHKIEPVWKQFGQVNIELRSEKAIMNKRIVLKEKSMHNAVKVSRVPEYPDPVDKDEQYWVNGTTDYLWFLLDIYYPPAPPGWQPGEPLPDPVYIMGKIKLKGTTWLVLHNGEIKRIEDGVVKDEGTGSAITIQMLLEDLIDDYSDHYNEPWTHNLEKDYEISLKSSIGDVYFDVIEEIAKQNGLFWDIKKGAITFKEKGIEYTQGNEYQEIRYDGMYPNNSNITNVSLIGTATRSNIVVGIDQDSNSIFRDDYTDRVYGAETETFRSGDLSQKTEKLLQDSNQPQRLYQVDIEANTLDVDVGDVVKLIVENTNKYFDINTEAMIVGKTIRYGNGSKQVSYKIGELGVDVFDIGTWLGKIQKKMILNKIKE